MARIFTEFTELVDSISFEHRTVTAVTRSISGIRQSLSYGGGFWYLKCTLRNTNFETSKKIASFFNSLEGRTEVFKLYLPSHFQSMVYSDSIIIDGANQIGKNINVKGITALNQVILKQGDFVKFDNSNKIYQAREDLVSNGSGNGVLKLHMPLVGDLPNDNGNVLIHPYLLDWYVALGSDTLSWDLDYFSRSTFEIELEEVWN